MSRCATSRQYQLPEDSEKIAVWTTRMARAASARRESKSGKRGLPGGGATTSGTGSAAGLRSSGRV